MVCASVHASTTALPGLKWFEVSCVGLLGLVYICGVIWAIRQTHTQQVEVTPPTTEEKLLPTASKPSVGSSVAIVLIADEKEVNRITWAWQCIQILGFLLTVAAVISFVYEMKTVSEPDEYTPDPTAIFTFIAAGCTVIHAVLLLYFYSYKLHKN